MRSYSLLQPEAEGCPVSFWQAFEHDGVPVCSHYWSKLLKQHLSPVLHPSRILAICDQARLYSLLQSEAEGCPISFWQAFEPCIIPQVNISYFVTSKILSTISIRSRGLSRFLLASIWARWSLSMFALLVEASKSVFEPCITPQLNLSPLPLHCFAICYSYIRWSALLRRGLLFIRTIDCHYLQCQILLSLPLSPPLSPLPLHCFATVILIFAGLPCCAVAC